MDPSYVIEEEDGFFPIPLAAMQSGTLAPVDLYICVQYPSKFALYKGAGTPLTDEVRERLMANGVHTLYLRKEDSETYQTYVEEHIEAIVRDEMLPREKACEIVYRTSERVMQDVLHDPRSGRNLGRAASVVEATVHSILHDPQAIERITAIASHDFHTYTHCVNVSMFLVGACRYVFGVLDRARLVHAGLGGILHDIGMSSVAQRIIQKPGKLTPEEFQEIKRHPLIGVEMLSGRSDVHPTALQIVRSHHERMDGTGYPDGLTAEHLPPEVRLATIVDVYDALTTDRPYAPAHKPFEALRVMVTEIGTHFDPEILKGFISFLGPSDVPPAPSAEQPAEGGRPFVPSRRPARRSQSLETSPAEKAEDNPADGEK